MQLKWYVYIDDERHLDEDKLRPQGFICITCRSYEAAIACLEELEDCPVVVDFDHDLGLGRSGYDVCKWIVENQYHLIGFHIHSMNPVGRRNMQQLLTHYGYIEI